MDREIINKAIQAYVKDPKKNVTRLIEYAKRLRALQKIKVWVGCGFNGGYEKEAFDVWNPETMQYEKGIPGIGITFEEGIKQTIAWYLENRQWWENL